MSQMVITQLLSLPDEGVTDPCTGLRGSFILSHLPSLKRRKMVTFNEVY
jgi:hypothetical protein